jgi:TatD DNase family protein
MPSTWTDLHAHLSSFDDNELAATLEEAMRSGVGTILGAATDLASSVTVVRQCRTKGPVILYGAVGISPFDVVNLPGGWEQQLAVLSQNPRIIAIGEIGIDESDNKRYPPVSLQLPVFERQIAIAAASGLPAIIHSRGAEQRAAELCKSIGAEKIVFHCFTGDRETLKKILDFGYYVSISGIATFSDRVRDLASYVPLDRLLIETDSPYLAPVPHRGKTNRPAWVGLVGEAVAACKGIDTETLKEALAENFGRLFQIAEVN